MMPVVAVDTTAGLYGAGAHSRLGEGFRVVSPGMLIEKGDEYLDANGRFLPFSLERIGQPVPADAVVRRIGSRPVLRF